MLENASCEIYYFGVQCTQTFVSIYLENIPFGDSMWRAAVCSGLHL